MPTNIKEIEDCEGNLTILRVSGSIKESDAILLEKIAVDLRQSNGRKMMIDFSDLNFLDSDSAPIIKRLKDKQGFEIEGLEYFLQKIVDEAEKRSQ